MDPFTIGMMAVSAAGGGLKAFGNLMQGGAAARSDYAEGEMEAIKANLYGINADTAKFNVGLLTTQAEIAGEGVKLAEAKAALQKGRIAEQGRQTLAAQRSEFTARNIDPTFGSPLLASGLTASRVTADLELTDAQGAIDAADALTKKANIMGQAVNEQGKVVTNIGAQITSSLRSKALFAKSTDDATAGDIAALSTILSTVGGLGKFGSGGSSGFDSSAGGTTGAGYGGGGIGSR